MACCPRRLAAAFLALASGVGCATAPSEVIVLVESDLAIPTQLDRVEVTIAPNLRTPQTYAAMLDGAGAQTLPLTLGLRSTSGTNKSFSVTVRGTRLGGEVATVQRSTRFVPGQRVVLRITLSAACRGVVCQPEQSCEAGRCSPIAVDPSQLPPYVAADAGVSSDGGVREAGPSCSADAAVVGQPDGCVLQRPPARPTCGNGDGPPVTFGLIDPVLDQGGERWRMYGFDLDGLCSDATATNPVVECTADGLAASDGPRGIDNAYGAALGERFLMIDPNLASRARAGARAGNNLPLIRLEGWNGQQDDPRVRMVLAYSLRVVVGGAPDGGIGDAGPRSDTGPRPDGGIGDAGRVDAGFPPFDLGGLPFDAGGGFPFDLGGFPLGDLGFVIPDGFTIPRNDAGERSFGPPLLLNGTDLVFVGSLSFAGGDEAFPLVSDDNAYVAGGVLVAKIPERADIALPALAGTLRIRITDGRVTMRISPDGQTVTDALLTGRWANMDILGQLPPFGLCPGDPFTTQARDSITNFLNRSADVRSTAGSGGPGARCDAISIAIPFERGARVVWGGVEPTVLEPNPCP